MGFSLVYIYIYIYIYCKKFSNIFICIKFMVASIYISTYVASGLPIHWNKRSETHHAYSIDPGSNFVNITIPDDGY